MPKLGTAVYEFAYWVVAFVMTVGFRVRVKGRHNVPRHGPFLLIANHQSFIDPPAIGLCTRRHISYLARNTLFANPAFGYLLRILNSVPIDQEGVGKEGIRNIIAKLEEGCGVLVFPEGERTWTGKMQKLKPGVALLLKRVTIPIVPVGIAGAYQAWPRTKPLPAFGPLFLPGVGESVTISVGKPRDPKTLNELSREDLLATLFSDIAAQLECAEAMRAK